MTETTAHSVDHRESREHTDAHLLRTVIARECDTVNEYNELAAKASEPAIQALLFHLADEEKEHIAECSLLLARLDPSYQSYLKKPLSHVDPSLDFETPAVDEPLRAAARVESTLGCAPTTLTVGSLFKEPHHS